VAVTLVEGGKPIHEAVIIADEIARLKSDGVAFNDIAILARNSTHFSELVQVLSDAGIPVVTEKKQLAGELFEIAVLNNVLVACAGAEDEIQLAIALLKQSFVFDFSAEDLANEKLGKTDAKLSNKIQGFNDFLARFRALAAEKNCADILGAFLAEFDVIDKLLITPGGEARVKNIYAFLNKLRRADYGSTARQYSYLLQNQMLDDLGIDASCGGTGGGAVRVMTIHGAKGLEFPNVFLFNAGGGWSSADKRKGVAIDCNLGLCVNSTDIDENIKKSSLARLGSGLAFDRKRIAEEMRLLYVALTRAKNRLFIVGSVSEKQRKAPRRAFTDFEILSAKNYLDFIQPETDVIKAADIVLTREKGVTRVLTARPAPERTAALAARFNHTYAHTAASTAPQKASVTSLSAAEQEYSETRPIRSFFEKDRGTEYGTKFHEAMQRQEPFDDATRRAKLIVDEFLSGMQVLRELVLFENIEKEGQRILVQGVIDVLAVQKNSPGGDALPRNASQSGGARTHARAVLIDYKTTRAPEKRLRELYLPQLSLYADAVARSLGLAPEIYIYSTHHEKLIQL
jgi:ATP-dependent exoDNAse (exonuclease V) beta subunit